MISKKLKIQSKKVIIAKKDSYVFEKINNYVSKNNWISLFYKNLQHSFDEFTSSIKSFTTLYSQNNKSKKYPSHIEKLLK